MLLGGFNNNIPYKGKVYHVQTENSGFKNPVIVTLIYLEGKIIASKKTGYEHIVEKPDYEDTVKRLLGEQHRDMIKRLLAGEYTGEAG